MENASLNDTLPAPLIRSMTSERTFAAVQAALAQQPRGAGAHDMDALLGVFSATAATVRCEFTDARHYLLTDHALSGQDGKAYQALMAQRDARWRRPCRSTGKPTSPGCWRVVMPTFTPCWRTARPTPLTGWMKISARAHRLDAVEAAMGLRPARMVDTDR